MDRDAIARARRRQQVREAIDFEREREEALADELADRVGEVDGPRLDERVFASLEPEEVELLRELLQPAADEEDAGDEFTLDDIRDDDDADAEDEIARLTDELDQSRRRRRAYERYLAVLDGAGTVEPGDRRDGTRS